MDRVNVQYTDSGEIIDFLTGKVIKDTPEERVRQSFMRVLCDDYGYPKDIMRREVPVQSGSSILLDKFGAPIRADIVVYNNAKAAAKLDQGNIRFVVECKKPNVSEGYAQLVSYIYIIRQQLAECGPMEIIFLFIENCLQRLALRNFLLSLILTKVGLLERKLFL